jgi:DNA-binding transcriptional regulator YhcF (GntR family)
VAVRVEIDRDDPWELHLQLESELRWRILDGKLTPGAPLGSARAIAEANGVGIGTVLRALRLLRDEALVELERGRSGRVAVDDDGQLPSRMTENQVERFIAAKGRLLIGTDSLRTRVDVDVLRRVLARASDEDTICSILYMLGHRFDHADSHRAAPEMVKLLDDPRDGVRHQAVAMLDHVVGREGAADTLALVPGLPGTVKQMLKRETDAWVRRDLECLASHFEEVAA